jgi:hypothetical protein
LLRQIEPPKKEEKVRKEKNERNKKGIQGGKDIYHEFNARPKRR